MVNKYVNEIVIQGNYGYGWDDLCFAEDEKDARELLKVYRENENIPVRSIRRRSLNPEYEKTLKEVVVWEYKWGTKGALPLVLSFSVPDEKRNYNMEADMDSNSQNFIYYYDISTLIDTEKKRYMDNLKAVKEVYKTYKVKDGSLEGVLKELSKHYPIKNLGNGLRARRTSPARRTTPKRKSSLPNFASNFRKMI